MGHSINSFPASQRPIPKTPDTVSILLILEFQRQRAARKWCLVFAASQRPALLETPKTFSK